MKLGIRMKIGLQHGFSALASVALLSVTGCGGGGGSSPATPSATLSGIAAAGAPIAGNVSVKDSLGAIRTVPVAADGKYNLDVSGMTAPFMLRAEGMVGSRSYTIYSAALAADINNTVNVTPLTDLIVANVAGQIAATLYSGGSFAGLTPAALAQAQTTLRTSLQPVLTALGLDASTDLLRAVFNADHTGQDALLDMLRVTVDPVTVQATILNLINNQQIVDDLASQSALAVADATGVAAGATDIQQIVAQLNALSALFASSLPAPSNPSLLGLFDTGTFKYEGNNLTGFLNGLTTDPTLIGMKISSVSLETLDSAAGTGKVNFVLEAAGKKHNLSFFVVRTAGTWKLAGDQRIAAAGVTAYSMSTSVGHYHPGIFSGLALDMSAGNTSPAMHYAVVTGKGLPTTGGGADGASAGALLVNYLNGRFTPGQGPYIGPSTPRLTDIFGFTIFGPWIPLSDVSIGLIADNETYTIKIYSDPNNTPANLLDDTLLATYTESVARRPKLSTELSAASFPSISTSAAQVGSFASNGGEITVNWSLPAGLIAGYIDIYRAGGDNLEFTDAGLTATATSSSLTWLAAQFAVTSYGVELSAFDAFGREVVTKVGSN
jgi:hypothetical protein